MDYNLIKYLEHLSGGLWQEESNHLLFVGQCVVVHYQTLTIRCIQTQVERLNTQAGKSIYMYKHSLDLSRGLLKDLKTLKALKCKPSPLLFAKVLLRVRKALRKRMH